MVFLSPFSGSWIAETFGELQRALEQAHRGFQARQSVVAEMVCVDAAGKTQGGADAAALSQRIPEQRAGAVWRAAAGRPRPGSSQPLRRVQPPAAAAAGGAATAAVPTAATAGGTRPTTGRRAPRCRRTAIRGAAAAAASHEASNCACPSGGEHFSTLPLDPPLDPDLGVCSEGVSAAAIKLSVRVPCTRTVCAMKRLRILPSPASAICEAVMQTALQRDPTNDPAWSLKNTPASGKAGKDRTMERQGGCPKQAVPSGQGQCVQWPFSRLDQCVQWPVLKFWIHECLCRRLECTHRSVKSMRILRMRMSAACALRMKEPWSSHPAVTW